MPYVIIVVDGRWNDNGITVLIVPMIFIPPATGLTAITLYPIEKLVRNRYFIVALIITPLISAVISASFIALMGPNPGRFLRTVKLFSIIGLGWGVLWAATGIIYLGASKLIGRLPADNQPD